MENGQQQSDDLDQFVAGLPEMREKEAAALVEARNALVAGWLWRAFLAGTPAEESEISVGQCCALFSAGDESNETTPGTGSGS